MAARRFMAALPNHSNPRVVSLTAYEVLPRCCLLLMSWSPLPPPGPRLHVATYAAGFDEVLAGLFRVTGPDSVYEWRGGGALVTSNTYPSSPSISRPSLRHNSPSSAWPSASLFGDVCGVFIWPPDGSSWDPPFALRSRRRAHFIA